MAELYGSLMLVLFALLASGCTPSVSGQQLAEEPPVPRSTRLDARATPTPAATTPATCPVTQPPDPPFDPPGRPSNMVSIS